MNTTDTLTSRLEAEGWKPRTLPGFAGLVGPLWTRKEGLNWVYGIVTGAQHLNPAAMVHGGLLMSLMDHTLSAIAWESTGHRACVTVQMDTKFLSAARADQFLKARGHVTHATGSMVFAAGDIVADGVPVLTGSAVLKLIDTAK